MRLADTSALSQLHLLLRVFTPLIIFTDDMSPWQIAPLSTLLLELEVVIVR